MAQPHVIYQARPGSALEVDQDFYARLAPDADPRTLVDHFVIPRRSGRAWQVIWPPAAELLQGWTSPPPSDDRGGHGLSEP